MWGDTALFKQLCLFEAKGFQRSSPPAAPGPESPPTASPLQPQRPQDPAYAGRTAAASPMALVLPQLLVNWVSLGNLLRFHESLPYKAGCAQEVHKHCDRELGTRTVGEQWAPIGAALPIAATGGRQAAAQEL